MFQKLFSELPGDLEKGPREDGKSANEGRASARAPTSINPLFLIQDESGNSDS
ncbi:MAG: hypothetical protein ACJAVK_003280 [Akkermansiaceae bacterium]|jgi:hypothetical protein